jgi:AcrR family transcriptional regulator
LAVEPDTRATILTAAKEALLGTGYASLSTRRIAETAGVPLSQIHYHFGSKQNLVLEVLDEENRRLLDRQARMYGEDAPLWKQWEQACDFLEDDLESGYVRVLQEMVAAGWSNEEIATVVRQDVRGWADLLTVVAGRAGSQLGALGPFTASEIATLVALCFLGAETMILLGVDDDVMPARTALRRVGELLRALEDGDAG